MPPVSGIAAGQAGECAGGFVAATATLNPYAKSEPPGTPEQPAVPPLNNVSFNVSRRSGVVNLAGVLFCLVSNHLRRLAQRKPPTLVLDVVGHGVHLAQQFWQAFHGVVDAVSCHNPEPNQP